MNYQFESKADAVYSGVCNLGYEISQQFANTNAQMASCCYLIAVNATFTAPAAGTVVLNVSRNGTPIEGATASAVVSTANTEVHSLSFTTTVKSLLAAPDTLSIVNAGVAANFSNVELDIYRL